MTGSRWWSLWGVSAWAQQAQSTNNGAGEWVRVGWGWEGVSLEPQIYLQVLPLNV